MEKVVHLPVEPSAVVLVVAVLAMIGLGIIVQVILREQERGISLRAVAGHLASILWAAPVIAALAVLAMRAAPHLRDGEVPLPDPAFPVVTGHGDLPARVVSWMEDAPRPARHVGTAVFTSGRYPTIEQADDEVLAEAADRIRSLFHQRHPWKGEWTVPPGLVRAALRDRFVEDVWHTSGTNRFLMHRVHARLELSPDLRERLYESWRSQIAGRRLAILGSLIALATLVTGTTAAYFRLDNLSHGTCRHRPKLAAVSLIIAGAVAAGALLPAA